MDCKQFSHIIDKILDKNLTLTEEKEYKEHITNCETCREDLNNLLDLDLSLTTLDKKDLPADFTSKVVTAAKNEGLLRKKPTKISVLSKISLAVASFLFLFLLLDVTGLNFNRPQDQTLDNVNPLQDEMRQESLEGDTEPFLGFLSDGTAQENRDTSTRNLLVLFSAVVLSTPFFVEAYKKKTTY